MLCSFVPGSCMVLGRLFNVVLVCLKIASRVSATRNISCYVVVVCLFL